MKEEIPSMYNLGREARRLGYSKDACNIPMSRFVHRSWWLAGFHDEDMEIIAKNDMGEVA